MGLALQIVLVMTGAAGIFLPALAMERSRLKKAIIGSSCVLLLAGLALTVLTYTDPPIADQIAARVASLIHTTGATTIHPADEKLPGFATGMMVKINDVTEERKKYQFYFHTAEGSKAEFYLSASNRYAFTVTDTHGSVYTLDIPLGSNGIPFEKFVYIFCEAGTASGYSYLRGLVNGKEVARRDFDFPLELGSRKWIPTIGADQNGKNNGAFAFMEMGVFSATLNDTELMALTKNTLEAYGLN